MNFQTRLRQQKRRDLQRCDQKADYAFLAINILPWTWWQEKGDRPENLMQNNIRILTAGDSSLLIEFGKEISPEINRKIAATVQLMKEQHIEGVVDMIPAFCSLLINYDPRVVRYDKMKKRLESLVRMDIKVGAEKRRIFEIPVVYGGEYGPDLAAIAQHAGLSEAEVINIHSSQDYLI